jgi:hypothetical protein
MLLLKLVTPGPKSNMQDPYKKFQTELTQLPFLVYRFQYYHKSRTVVIAALFLITSKLAVG